jgi:hypothetical protein
VKKESTDLYYWPVNAVAGAMTLFPVGGIFGLGGNVVDLFTWTMGMGEDIEDVLVIQTSAGQLAGYRGYDPSDADNWLLDSIYTIGRPLADRTNVSLFGDVMMLTEHGLVSLSSVVTGEYRLGAGESTASGRISKTLNTIVAQTSSAPAWEVSRSSFHQYIIINIPGTANLAGRQYVMNSITGAWTRYTLPDVLHFHEHDGALYFTDTNGRVLIYGNVTVDNVALDGSSGTPIQGGFQQAYSYFDSPGDIKHFKMVHPIFESTTLPSFRLKALVDFNPNGLQAVGVAPPPTGGVSIWDSGEWDDAIWSPPNTSWGSWYGVVGLGYAGSIAIRTTTTFDCKYVATNWLLELGAGL